MLGVIKQKIKIIQKIKIMEALLVKHPKNYFGVRKDKMYHNGTLKTTLSFAFGKYRLLIS